MCHVKEIFVKAGETGIYKLKAAQLECRSGSPVVNPRELFRDSFFSIEIRGQVPRKVFYCGIRKYSPQDKINIWDHSRYPVRTTEILREGESILKTGNRFRWLY
jgi:hypothetical protein